MEAFIVNSVRVKSACPNRNLAERKGVNGRTKAKSNYHWRRFRSDRVRMLNLVHYRSSHILPSFRAGKGKKPIECGYAFYQPLSGRKIKEVSQPSYTLMLFDSTKGQRNYADSGQSLAFRHLNGVVVAFVDGRVRWLKETEAKRVFKQRNKP
ncbi:MAG: H-X9-DG-CTERM domain-containing protein [Armatimonadota bacterium]